MSLAGAGQLHVGGAGQAHVGGVGQVPGQDGRLLGLGKEADWVVGGAFFGFAAGIIQLLANKAIQVTNICYSVLNNLSSDVSTPDFVSL